MRGVPLLLATTVLVGFTLACLGQDNVGACEAYVDQVNAIFLECGADADLRRDSTCPDSLNEGDVDCTGYYKCLADAYSCTEEGIEVDTSECAGCDGTRLPYHRDHERILFPEF